MFKQEFGSEPSGSAKQTRSAIHKASHFGIIFSRSGSIIERAPVKGEKSGLREKAGIVSRLASPNRFRYRNHTEKKQLKKTPVSLRLIPFPECDRQTGLDSHYIQ
jgi:hypothetical protein